MSLNIYLLIPRNYIKKSHKSHEVNEEIEKSISELRKKISDWNYKLDLDDTVGSVYKLKFDQFEKKFLRKSDFVFILVNSQSEDAFKSCVEKLIKTCKNPEKLANIAVLSLSAKGFEELKNNSVKFIFIGNEMAADKLNKWDKLENMLKVDNIYPRSILEKENIGALTTIKSEKISNNSGEESQTKTSLSISIPISGRKSPSKFKTFFNSLPSKFESERRTLHRAHKEEVENTSSSHQDVRLPNINVSEISGTGNEGVPHAVGLRSKVDSSKLSLNSLFKRRSKKARDSGLSLNSSVSTGSGSRKSEVIINKESMSTDGKEITISSNDHSPVILTAKIEKAEKHKAKIEVFKAKASKVIRSSSCLHSPKVKRAKYNVKNVINNVVSFSSTLMTASSDIGNQSENINRKAITFLINSRGKSEPPGDLLKDAYTDTLPNGIIKYYSWNDISNECKNQLEYEQEVPVIVNQKEFSLNLIKTKSNSSSLNEVTDICKPEIEVLLNNDINNETCSEDEVFHTTFRPIDKTDIFDENQNFLNNSFRESSYSTFLPSIGTSSLSKTVQDASTGNLPASFESKNETKTAKSLNKQKLKDDPMESLDKLIKSIQVSCEEMRATRKSFECNKSDDDQKPSETDLVNSEDSACHSEDEIVVLNNESLEGCKEVILDENCSAISCEIYKEDLKMKKKILPVLELPISQMASCHQMSLEIMAAADSISKVNSPTNLFQQTYQRMIRNPIIVSGLFAATTYTAPIWCSYIPRNICLTKIFFGTLDYLYSSEMVQAIPNHIILTGRNTVSAASKTIKRILF